MTKPEASEQELLRALVEKLKTLVEKWHSEDEDNGGTCLHGSFCCHGPCAAELEAVLKGNPDGTRS